MILGLCVVLALSTAALSFALLQNRWPGAQAFLFLGSILLGIAYGGLQSTSLVHAFRTGGVAHLANVSVLWNVSFDLGTGVGALVTGSLATVAGFPIAFTCLAIISTLGSAMALRALYSAAGKGYPTS